MLIIDIRLTLCRDIDTSIFGHYAPRWTDATRQLAGQQRLADMTAGDTGTLSVSGVLLTKTFGRQQDEIGRFAEARTAISPAFRSASK
ncbi:MAG: hypothetical protein R2849_03405 [Thermomicrobiales bacterium]